MFDEVFGIPAHPLMVHAAVVFGPLLAVVALVFVLVPRFRAQVSWLAAALAVVAPVATLASVLSGNAFLGKLPEELRERMTTHRNFGFLSLWVSVLLGLVVLVILFLGRRAKGAGEGGAPPRWLSAAGTVVVVLLALVSLLVFVRAGHTGAEAVWGGN
ncbi:hypothetical protein GCM10010123_22460 [Pilimelia anulata]|uniref:DUF2231 domain-containing protein n=1 Tax=Pilimelia anulata TaxID=53371 RepID=A0A8J3B833_9ACTN|nr:DUF2231 domain-containing protein [Pilimelia anulata]GGJ92162.1 hypothetical protein GCM10010123_22460 [Pilimelia anulata]